MTRDRMTCPTCKAPRWVKVETNGNGGTYDVWEACDNGCPIPGEVMSTETRGRGQRLTPEQRATVMVVIRANPEDSNMGISRLLNSDYGIDISAQAIGTTYRPKLAPTTNGKTNGNGEHDEPELKRGKRSLPDAERPPEPSRSMMASMSVLTEALRTFAGHLSECMVHVDEGFVCTCGFAHVEELIGPEEPIDAATRQMKHRGGIQFERPFWEIEISVKPTA